MCVEPEEETDPGIRFRAELCWRLSCPGSVSHLLSALIPSDYYLPKDEVEFYQFCYIDVTGQVRGASTPFCFKSPEELSLTSGLDDDILVVTTQVSNANRRFGAKASDWGFSLSLV